MIPRVVHQIYGIFNDKVKWEDIPDFRESHRKTIKYCQENGIQLKFWNLEMVEELLNNEYEDYKDLWNEFRYPIQKADFARYMILHHEGGIYVDMDIYPLRNINELFLKDFFFCRWNTNDLPYIAVLGTEGGTQLYQDILDHVNESTYEKQSMEIYHKWQGRLVFQTTGHKMLARVLKKHNITERLNIISVINNTKSIYECVPNDKGLFYDNNTSVWYNTEEKKASFKCWNE